MGYCDYIEGLHFSAKNSNVPSVVMWLEDTYLYTVCVVLSPQSWRILTLALVMVHNYVFMHNYTSSANIFNPNTGAPLPQSC